MGRLFEYLNWLDKSVIFPSVHITKEDSKQNIIAFANYDTNTMIFASFYISFNKYII
jgi:hypothetical protein